jgi:hypothetical protein
MRTPALFIAGNESGYFQEAFDDDAYPHHVVRYTRIYSADTLEVSRDNYLPARNGLVTIIDRLIFKSTAPQNQIRLSRYLCVTRLTINGRRFAVRLEPGQALCLNVQNGALNLQVAPDVDCPLIVYTDKGPARIQTGAGLTELHLGEGDHQVTVGRGLTFIRAVDPDKVTIDGHYLKGAPGRTAVLVRNAEGDDQLTAPVPAHVQALGTQGLEVVGTEAFKQQVEDNLQLLRRLPCGRALLAALERPGRGYPIRITEQTGVGWTCYQPSTEESDKGSHFIEKGRPGFGFSGGRLLFAPYRAGTVELPLLELYRALCMAWNSINGTVFPGEVRLNYRGRNVDVPACELQAIGISTGLTPFDFETGEGSSALDTNPPPFTENTLRQALGLAPFAFG